MKFSRMSRRYFLAVSTLAAAVPLLAACTGTAPASPTAAPAPAAPTAPVFKEAKETAAPAAAPAVPAATPTAAPAVVQPTNTPAAAPAASGSAATTLKLLWWQAPTILNPHLAQGTKDNDAAHLILEPLAAMGPDGLPVARLAAEVPTVQNGGVSADLKTVTWKLKPGVKWHDGSPFTADDVVFTFTYMADKATAATTSAAADGVDKVVAKDPNTAVVSYKDPNPNFYQFGVGTQSLIIQKAQFKDYMADKAKDAPGNLKPVGTGPYMVTDFKPGDVLTANANPNYHVTGKPAFKDVQLKGGGDATSAARAVFQTGDVDYAWNMQVEATVLRQLMQAGKGELVTAVSPQVERLLLNRADPNKDVGGAKSEPSTKHPFLSDLKVRQALAMACDRATIAGQLYGAGLTGDATTNIVTAPPAYNSPNTAKLDTAKFDLDAAGKLLDSAGWVKGSDGIRAKDGVKMAIKYQTSVNPLRQKTQDIIKQSWTQLGIQVELKSIDAKVFFSSDPGNPDTASHFYADVEMYTNGSDQPDPTTYLGSWVSKQIAQKSNEWRGQNTERWNSPDFDATFDQYNKETDPDKRKNLIIKLNDLLVSDVVIIPLVARRFPVGARSKTLQGVLPDPWESDLWNVVDWSRGG